MRRAEEEAAWSKFQKAVPDADPLAVTLASGKRIEFRSSCSVVAGRNGSGKSRLLKALADQLGERAIHIELHHLCQRLLDATTSREDFEAMIDEFSPDGPDKTQTSYLSRIVGRDYEELLWYAFEIDLAESFDPDDFKWDGEQTLVPYFKARYRGIDYSTLDMGLGELAAHLLFWILNQYRDQPDMVVILDEPDAFLPPSAAAGLLAALLDICMRHHWRLILSTHSDELIRRALAQESLMVLAPDEAGEIGAQYSDDDPEVAEHLLTRGPVENVLFVEDESAWYLTSELVRARSRSLLRSTGIVWGHGEGDLRNLHEHLPRQPKPDLRFGLVFDGDQRGSIADVRGRWPAALLPTDMDPDELFRTLASSPDELAAELSIGVDELTRFLPVLEGTDAHDWVNRLGDEYGRPNALRALARLWVSHHAAEAEAFVTALTENWAS